MFAAVILENISEIAEKIFGEKQFSKEAMEFSLEVREAVEQYGILPGEPEPFYAYEVDGYGQYNVMDDANLPSLLSIPYFGYATKDNERYQNTRAKILSDRNPYYYKGTKASGIGSPHTPVNYIWHISMAVQAITSLDEKEKEDIIHLFETTDGGTGLMHESFFVEDPSQYTREWFSWANSVFCEMILDYMGEKVIL